MSSPTLAFPPSHRLDTWLLRSATLLGLTIGFSLVVDLILLPLCPQSLEFCNRLMSGDLSLAGLLGMTYDSSDVFSLMAESYRYRQDSNLGFILILMASVPFIVGYILWRIRSWQRLAGGALVLAAVLAYLVADDPIYNYPVTIDQLSPTFPEAEASYQALMRYGKNHPLGRNFRAPDRLFQDAPRSDRFVDVDQPAAWAAWLRRRRSAIELDWADLAPVRAWIEELNHFDHIGDLMPARYDAEIMTFSAPRSYTQHACEMAGLQALDGRGDEAIATQLPLLEVSRKLEPSARTLVRAMIARVMQQSALRTAAFVLDTTPVSPAMRSRLTAALTMGIGSEAGVRHLAMIEYTLEFGASDNQSLGNFIPFQGSHKILRLVLNVTGPFVYNPRHTMNLIGEYTANVQEAAARRDLAGIDRIQQTYFKNLAQPRFKNYVGSYLASLMFSPPTRMIETYWKVEGARLTLLARLTKS